MVRFRPARRFLPVGALLTVAPALVAGIACDPKTTTAAAPSPQSARPTAAPSVDEARLPPLTSPPAPAGTFRVTPYLQMGDAPALGGATERMTLMWQTAAAMQDAAAWTVETRPAGGDKWNRQTEAPVSRSVAVSGVAAHRVWSVGLSGLVPGNLFDYRVLKSGTPVFAARARARRPATQPFRFALFGDSSDGSPSQKRIAQQVSLAKPDFVLITGDIVYPRGRASEYDQVFWPVYAPLMRATLFVGVSGNHDLDYADLNRYPDGLAYYFYWMHPQNGPILKPFGPHTPPIKGPEANRKAFLEAAGKNYPNGASFSFDYGSAHFTVIDSNYYTDWTDPALVAWLEKDLAAAQNAEWRFVSFHVPPFSSTKLHQEEQWTRILCPLLEKHGVDVVWTGHVHNYQRTHPLRFDPVLGPTGEYVDRRGRVHGEFTLDTSFDGKTQTFPQGVIYIVSGGGGAPLYKGTVGGATDRLESFTAKYIENTHSFTLVDVKGKVMTVRQVDDAGKELDRWTVAKP